MIRDLRLDFARIGIPFEVAKFVRGFIVRGMHEEARKILIVLSFCLLMAPSLAAWPPWRDDIGATRSLCPAALAPSMRLLRIEGPYRTEAIGAIYGFGRPRGTIRTAREPRIIGNRAASNHSSRFAFGAGTGVVQRPFPHITVHIEQTPFVRFALPYGVRCRAGIAQIP